VGFLRAGLLASLPVAAVGALVAGVLGGWSAAVSVLVGAAVVALFFCVSGAVIAWAGRAGDAFTLPAALGTFLVKVLVIGAVFRSLPEDGFLDLRVLGWTVVAGALFWSVVQGRWVWNRQLYYAAPPAPSRPPGGETGTGGAQALPVDPETPTTRG
jgi:ATP synthase protein I